MPLADVFAWARPQSLPVVVFPGCGHFFHGRLPQLQAVAAYPSVSAVVRPAWNDKVLVKRHLDIGAQTLQFGGELLAEQNLILHNQDAQTCQVGFRHGPTKS